MHDSNGTPLEVGDVVVIYATVTDVYATDDYCNVSVFHAINTKQLTLVERSPKE